MTQTQTKTKKSLVVPNIERVICKIVNISSSLRTSQNNILVPGQLKAGENLLAAVIVSGGATKFKEGQLIYYSEYSASRLVDVGAIIRDQAGFKGIADEKYEYIIIAEDDIMAYEEEIDPELLLNTQKADVWSAPTPSSIIK